MAEFTTELFLQALGEWGRYLNGLGDLPAQRQGEFLKEQGFASGRELLTHVAAWWQEGRSVIADAIKDASKPARKYDLDAFNAAALKRFEGLSEAEFIAWYEAERQKMIAVVRGLSPEQFGIRRVQNWLDAVLLEHLKEHGFDAPRFLVADILAREWADCRDRFAALTAEQKTDYLKKQGFARFADLLAHVVAWWEQGIGVIETASAQDPCDVEDVDAFNAAAVRSFAELDEAGAASRFEQTRLMLGGLVDMLPDEVLRRPNIEGWLRADVLDHYYEHAL
jgi:hypothetical protein